LIFVKETTYKEIIDLINLSKFSESLNLLKKLENSYSDDVDFNNLFGFVYQNLNDFDNANNYYKKSLKLDNENFETNFNIGILSYKRKDFEESEKIFINLSKRFTKNKDIFYNLGVIKYEMTLYNDAIKYFKKSLILSDQFYFAQHHLAQCYEKLNNIDLAIENYRKAEIINFNKFNNTLNNLGTIFLNLKKYDQAEKYFLDALNYQGNMATIYNNLALLYLEILDADKAYYYLEKSKKHITFKFLTPKEENIIDKLEESYTNSGNVAPTITKSLEMMIKSVDGETDQMLLHNFITNLPIMDSQKFRKFVNENYEKCIVSFV
jgi:tetratricopeptide (TPR) repeat protein